MSSKGRAEPEPQYDVPERAVSVPSHAMVGREAVTMAPDDDAWRQRGQDALMRIPVAVRIVLGGTRMPFAKLMALTRGSVIPLDRKVGDLVDIVVNDRLVARGEVVVLNDDAQRFAIAVRDVVRSSDS